MNLNFGSNALPIPAWQKKHALSAFEARSTKDQLTIVLGGFERTVDLPGVGHSILSDVIRFFAMNNGIERFTDRIIDVFRSRVDGVSINERVNELESKAPRALRMQAEIQLLAMFESFFKKNDTRSVDLQSFADSIVTTMVESYSDYLSALGQQRVIAHRVNDPETAVAVEQSTVAAAAVAPVASVEQPVANAAAPVAAAPQVAATEAPALATASQPSPVFVAVDVAYPENFLKEVPYASAKEKNDRFGKAVKFYQRPQEMAKAVDVIEGLLSKEMMTPELMQHVIPATLAEIYIQMPASLEVGLAPYGYAVKLAQLMLQRGAVPQPTALAFEAFVRGADWERFLRLKNDPNASYQLFFAELLKDSIGALGVKDVATSVTHLSGQAVQLNGKI